MLRFSGSRATDTPREWETHLQFKEAPHFSPLKENKEQREDKGYKKSSIQSVLFTDKAGAETLMNAGCGVFGQDTTSVSRCFQVLPTHFSGDHPFDPVLIPSQTIVRPKSTTYQLYEVIIHVSLWPHQPARDLEEGAEGIVVLCLFWFSRALQ